VNQYINARAHTHTQALTRERSLTSSSASHLSEHLSSADLTSERNVVVAAWATVAAAAAAEVGSTMMMIWTRFDVQCARAQKHQLVTEGGGNREVKR
jgi:hypothetical protein